MKKKTRRELRNNHEPSPKFLNLPEELITEILLRSPVRTIGRFRCVSKRFCSLLSDPKFAKNHVDLAIRKSSCHRKLIFSSRILYTVDIDLIGDRCRGIRYLAAVELNYPLKGELRDPCYLDMRNWNHKSDRRKFVEIVGSSNGLVCIYVEKSGAFLYNPTTGESKRIPESLRSRPTDKYCQEYSEPYGFGFDTLTDDYKLVKFVVASDESYPNADVYSLKTNSWRRISGLRYKHFIRIPGVHFNGAIHWVVELHKCQNNNQEQLVVAAFDLKREEFREMSLPDEAAQDWKFLEAATLKGQFCLVYNAYEKHDFIWVMNEYGNEGSWSKIQLSMSYRYMKPLCSTKNDEEVLLKLDGGLVLYNFERNTSRRNLKIRGFTCFYEPNIYVESFVSPNSYNNGIGI